MVITKGTHTAMKGRVHATCGCVTYCQTHNAAAEMLSVLREFAADYAHLCDEDDTESEGARLLNKARTILRAIEEGA